MEQSVEIRFYENVKDELLKFAVIVSRCGSKWVFCRHRERVTFEAPGGHREPGEDIVTTAGRELFEETGAVDYDLLPVCAYSVLSGGEETFGMLYFAQIRRLGPLPQSEIAEVVLFDGLPGNWTYPLIQPRLIEKIRQMHLSDNAKIKPLGD